MASKPVNPYGMSDEMLEKLSEENNLERVCSKMKHYSKLELAILCIQFIDRLKELKR